VEGLEEGGMRREGGTEDGGAREPARQLRRTRKYTLIKINKLNQIILFYLFTLYTLCANVDKCNQYCGNSDPEI
jgi:hypothetical protein